MNSLDGFIARVLEQEPQCSAEDIADMVWLAWHLPAGRAGAEPAAMDTPSSELETLILSSPDPTETESRRRPSQTTSPPSELAAGGPGNRVRVPAAPGLEQSLQFAGGLRPLRRLAPSRCERVIDYDQTVRRLVDEKIWLPVQRPKLERALSLALVLDQATSMNLWRPLVRDLRRLLVERGNFRQCRLWSLHTDTEPVRLTAGWRARADAVSRDPREVPAPGGQLVIVVSDCIAPAWYHGNMLTILETWGRRSHLVVFNPLGEYLWPRTRLGLATPVQLSAPLPAAGNINLRLHEFAMLGIPPAGLKLPVVELDPPKLQQWARMAMAWGGATAPGFVLSRDDSDLSQSPVPDGRDPRPPEHILAAFWQVASPPARHLLSLLAATPTPCINLHILRLVRSAFLPQCRPTHEAEVLYSGLFRPVAKEPFAEPDPEQVFYELAPPVRRLLLDGAPRYELERLWNYMQQQAHGLGDTVQAILADPGKAAQSLEQDTRLLFNVPLEIARRIWPEKLAEFDLSYGSVRRSPIPPVASPLPAPAVSTLRLWEGSPFPGLRAFTPKDAPIFFGRDQEIDGLVRKLAEPVNRFIVVVGASGSGKSSLVAAGLIPRLQEGAIKGSQDWDWVRFTPGGAGDNPFRGLAEALVVKLPTGEQRAYDLENQLCANPETLAQLADDVLQGQPPRAELLLFIDQFEELFTVVDPTQRGPFIELLALAARIRRLRIVATMRVDFYARCLDSSSLAELLRTGSYPLAAPGRGALVEMITGPAGRAGLTFEDGLVTRILEDTGTEPGALALMAFALAELYEARTQEGLLTHAAYDGFQGVQGAIAQRAETVFSQFDMPTQAVLSEVFREFIDVDDRGIVTRRRAALHQVLRTPAAAALVTGFTDARLLVTSQGKDHWPLVEVAHEALLRSWPRLAEWIETIRNDLWLRRQLQLAVREWEQRGRQKGYGWSDERVLEMRAMLQRLQLALTAAEQDFLGPLEPERMLAEIDDPATSHERRALIGVRLALIGDPRPGVGLRKDGLPDIAWCQVPGGKITLEGVGSPFHVNPCYIAKYPITWMQYCAFLEAADGYQNRDWWGRLAYRHDKPGRQFQLRDNHPVVLVCWYDAVAFCRWLSSHLGYEIRLPTEWEWQQAAMGSNPANVYPWGAELDIQRANTSESGLSRTTAVGMYLHGASPVGALDMSGNVWEWCLNGSGPPYQTSLTGKIFRAARGSSWLNPLELARTTYRGGLGQEFRSADAGFRLACLSPIL